MNRPRRSAVPSIASRALARPGPEARGHLTTALLALSGLVLWLWLAACEAEPQPNRYVLPPTVAIAGDGTPPIQAGRTLGSRIYSDTQDIGISVPAPFRATPESRRGSAAATDRYVPLALREGTPPDDASITASAESMLRATPGLDGGTIRVETHDGSVRLSGEVASAGLSNRASAVTRGVDGVSHVDNRLVVSPAPLKAPSSY